jgi:hypothetical protein
VAERVREQFCSWSNENPAALPGTPHLEEQAPVGEETQCALVYEPARGRPVPVEGVQGMKSQEPKVKTVFYRQHA